MEKEASYKLEPYIDYDGDFELHDISDLINCFKIETAKRNGAMTDGDSKALGEDND